MKGFQPKGKDEFCLCRTHRSGSFRDLCLTERQPESLFWVAPEAMNEEGQIGTTMNLHLDRLIVMLTVSPTLHHDGVELQE